MDKVTQVQDNAVNEEGSANKPIKSNTFSCDCAILYELFPPGLPICIYPTLLTIYSTGLAMRLVPLLLVERR